MSISNKIHSPPFEKETTYLICSTARFEMQVWELSHTGTLSHVWEWAAAYGSHHHFAWGPVNHTMTDRCRESAFLLRYLTQHTLFLISPIFLCNSGLYAVIVLQVQTCWTGLGMVCQKAASRPGQCSFYYKVYRPLQDRATSLGNETGLILVYCASTYYKFVVIQMSKNQLMHSDHETCRAPGVLGSRGGCLLCSVGNPALTR